MFCITPRPASEALMSNTTLTILDVAGDDHERYKLLWHVSISGCRIGNDGVRLLTQALKTNKTIKKLLIQSLINE